MQRFAEEEKSVSDYRFLLQTPHTHCAVIVCSNLIGNKSALCSTYVCLFDVFASTQQHRMRLAFLLDDATENSD